MNVTENKNGYDVSFRCWKVSQHNVKVVCKVVKEKFKLDYEKLGIKVEGPKIDVRAVLDEDFEKLRLLHHELQVNCGTPRAVALEQQFQRFEYGQNFSIDNDWVENCNGWTHIIWQDSRCNKVKSAEIYIRASIYEKNPDKFYAVLEHEVSHALCPYVFFADNRLFKSD